MTHKATLVSTKELSRLFSDQEDLLGKLIASGEVSEVMPGEVELVQAVQVYLAALRSELAANTATAAAEAARAARADAATLRLQERRREVVAVEECDVVLAYLCGVINSTLTALPARATRDVRARRGVEGVVFALRSRIAKDVGSMA